MSVPKLRFKEFDESWSQVILDDLAEVERGKFSVRPRNDPRYFGGKMPFVQTGDVTGSDVYLKGFSQTLNEDGIKVSKVFPEDTILITIAANIGDTTITQYPVACPDSVVAIQPKKELTNTIFLKNVIDLQKDFLDSQATQNAQKNINLQVLKPLELIVPSLKEQTKIASFLSAVDEKISQLTQKHELLSQYKQGMMQNLFSQQIRFKADDGSEFGDWEETTLGNIKGLSVASGRSSYEKLNLAQYPFYGSTGLIGYANEYDYQGIKILIARVGHNAGYIYMVDGKYSVSDNTLILEIPSTLNSKFIRAFLEKFQLNKLVFGTGQPLITGGLLKKVIVPLPCLEEQTKIANFLSSIDQKIEVVAQQIEQAKQWKKGLLQQMFV
jgi:type I restriction enzyme, S subunit